MREGDRFDDDAGASKEGLGLAHDVRAKLAFDRHRQFHPAQRSSRSDPPLPAAPRPLPSEPDQGRGLVDETRPRRPSQPVAAVFRGRPPLAPLARAAAAFVGDFVRPARRANSLAIQARVPKMPETSAGT